MTVTARTLVDLSFVVLYAPMHAKGIPVFSPSPELPRCYAAYRTLEACGAAIDRFFGGCWIEVIRDPSLFVRQAAELNTKVLVDLDYDAGTYDSFEPVPWSPGGEA